MVAIKNMQFPSVFGHGEQLFHTFGTDILDEFVELFFTIVQGRLTTIAKERPRKADTLVIKSSSNPPLRIANVSSAPSL